MICSLIPCSRPRAQTELLRTFQLMTLEQIPRTYHSQDCAVKCVQLDILVETMRSKLPFILVKVSLCTNLGKNARYQQARTQQLLQILLHALALWASNAYFLQLQCRSLAAKENGFWISTGCVISNAQSLKKKNGDGDVSILILS